MPVGPGKYDDYCTLIREEQNAEAVIVIVIGGKKGEGFSCQAWDPGQIKLVEILETVTEQLKAGIKETDENDQLRGSDAKPH